MKCLTTLKSFNEFYKEIEESHNSLTVETEFFKVQSLKIEFTRNNDLSQENVGSKLADDEDLNSNEYNKNNIDKSCNKIEVNSENENTDYTSLLEIEEYQLDPVDSKENEIDYHSSENEIVDDTHYYIQDQKLENDKNICDTDYTQSIDVSQRNSKSKNKKGLRGKVDSHKKSTNYDTSRMQVEDQQIRSVVNLKCDLCDYVFDVFRDCKSHFRTEHDIDGYLICCNNKYHKRVRLVEHIQRHIYPKGFEYVIIINIFIF